MKIFKCAVFTTGGDTKLEINPSLESLHYVHQKDVADDLLAFAQSHHAQTTARYLQWARSKRKETPNQDLDALEQQDARVFHALLEAYKHLKATPEAAIDRGIIVDQIEEILKSDDRFKGTEGVFNENPMDRQG